MGNCLSLIYIYLIADDDLLVEYKALPNGDKELSPVSSPRTLGSPYSNVSQYSDFSEDGE